MRGFWHPLWCLRRGSWTSHCLPPPCALRLCNTSKGGWDCEIYRKMVYGHGDENRLIFLCSIIHRKNKRAPIGVYGRLRVYSTQIKFGMKGKRAGRESAKITLGVMEAWPFLLCPYPQLPLKLLLLLSPPPPLLPPLLLPLQRGYGRYWVQRGWTSRRCY